MKLSLVGKHLRLHRGALAMIGGISGIGLAPLLVANALLLPDLSISQAMIWTAAALLILSAALLYTFRDAISVLATNGRGLRAYRQRKYADAEAFFRESLKRMEAWPNDDPCRIEVLAQLVGAARAQGNYDDAETFSQQRLAASEQVWGVGHDFTLQALDELADVYVVLARLSAAQPLLEQSLARREAKGELATFAFARCLHRLGLLSLNQDRIVVAETHLRRAFDVVKRLGMESTPDGLAVQYDFAVALLACGKIDEAATLAEACKGDDGLILALVRAAQNRLDEAERLAKASLAALERRIGASRPELRESYRLLGVIYQAQSRLPDAVRSYEKALKLCEDFLSPIDPDLAEILERYSGVLMQVGRVPEAESNALRARQIRDFHVHN